jgi:hypothetical protein
MKWALVAWVLLGLPFLTSVSGADSHDLGSTMDAAREFRNQDAALSLLLEAFRQIQSSVIESDYDSRIRAANSLRDMQVRDTVAILADFERYLRCRKLGKQVQSLLRAYEYARKDDEREAGVTVPSAVDLEAAATKLKSFRVIQGAPPVMEAGFEAPVFSSGPAASTQVSLPVQLQKYVTLLSGLNTNDEALVGAVESLLQQGAQQTDSVQTNPALIAISYRKRDGNATDVVVQLFDHPKQRTESVVANTRLASSRLGPDILGPVDEWLNILTESQVHYLGPEKEVRMRERAFHSALQADLTLMREQTVEPLHLIILMTEPERLLPQCLSRRVRSAVVEADLAFGEWQCRVHLMTADDVVAQQVELLLATWRELAMTATGIYAGSDTNPSARRALEAGTLEVKGNEVLYTGSAPSSLGIRVVTKLTRWSVEEVAWEDEAKMVTICEHGQTQQVPAVKVSVSLAGGAHLGPCR